MSTKKLPKKVLTANLLALAAADAATDHDHRARFDRLIQRMKKSLADAQGPEVIHQRGLASDFAEARLIARDKLRMKDAEFEAAVADLNGPYSRVVNTCPCGKDTRNLPDFLKMTADDLRLTYDLRTPFDAVFFVVRHGKTWGYSEAQIAQAEIEFRKLDRARRAKIAEADEARAALLRA
ncbi:hypothetical protein NN6n1_35240 [Shinella zoogloeoides]